MLIFGKSECWVLWLFNSSPFRTCYESTNSDLWGVNCCGSFGKGFGWSDRVVRSHWRNLPQNDRAGEFLNCGAMSPLWLHYALSELSRDIPNYKSFLRIKSCVFRRFYVHIDNETVCKIKYLSRMINESLKLSSLHSSRIWKLRPYCQNEHWKIWMASVWGRAAHTQSQNVLTTPLSKNDLIL